MIFPEGKVLGPISDYKMKETSTEKRSKNVIAYTENVHGALVLSLCLQMKDGKGYDPETKKEYEIEYDKERKCNIATLIQRSPIKKKKRPLSLLHPGERRNFKPRKIVYGEE